jgi:Uma2 family endonuclease
MGTSTGQMTWQAFEQLPDGDGFHREVVEGEFLVLPPAKSRHSLVTMAVAKALAPLEDGGLWSVFVEAGYRLSKNPPTWIQPDVSVPGWELAVAKFFED